jgi:hypothetical protein
MPPWESGVSLSTSKRAVYAISQAPQRLSAADDAAELRARGDAELAVDAGQVRFDRLRADEKCGRDVTVPLTGGRQFGDPRSESVSVVSRDGATLTRAESGEIE